MNIWDLSTAGIMCLAQIIYSGLSDAIEHDTINKETLKELFEQKASDINEY